MFFSTVGLTSELGPKEVTDQQDIVNVASVSKILMNNETTSIVSNDFGMELVGPFDGNQLGDKDQCEVSKLDQEEITTGNFVSTFLL